MASDSGGRLRAIAFRAAESPLGAFLEASRGQTIHVAGQVSGNVWNGVRSVQFRIVDAASA
jgi:single-stranded-DNA-specific exonuclease